MTITEKKQLIEFCTTNKWYADKNILNYLETVTVQEEPKGKRTPAQNNSLHLWFSEKAKQCREAGVTPQLAFSKTMELEMSEVMMKAIWKTVQKPLLGKSSTTELSKTEDIETMVDHLNRFFAEQFNLEAIDFPSEESKMMSTREDPAFAAIYEGDTNVHFD